MLTCLILYQYSFHHSLGTDLHICLGQYHTFLFTAPKITLSNSQLIILLQFSLRKISYVFWFHYISWVMHVCPVPELPVLDTLPAVHSPGSFLASSPSNKALFLSHYGVYLLVLVPSMHTHTEVAFTKNPLFVSCLFLKFSYFVVHLCIIFSFSPQV